MNLTTITIGIVKLVGCYWTATILHEIGHLITAWFLFSYRCNWKFFFGSGKPLFDTKYLQIGLIPMGGAIYCLAPIGTKNSDMKYAIIIAAGPIVSLLGMIIFWHWWGIFALVFLEGSVFQYGKGSDGLRLWNFLKYRRVQ